MRRRTRSLRSHGVPWMTKLDKALARAKQEAKPVLVFCYMPHAPAARHLKEKIWSDAALGKSGNPATSSRSSSVAMRSTRSNRARRR